MPGDTGGCGERGGPPRGLRADAPAADRPPPGAALPPPCPTVLPALPLSRRAEAAALVWSAFGAAVAPGARRRAGVALLRRCLARERVLAAVGPDRQLLGVVALRVAAGGLIDARPAARGAILGRAARWRDRAAALAPPRPATRDAVLDGLVVAPAARGQGVAAALVAAAAHRACRQGYPGLRAEVAPRNVPALRLYRRLGFQPAGRVRTGWLRHALVLRLPFQDG